MRRLVFGVDRDPGVMDELRSGSANRLSNGVGRLGAQRTNPMLVYGRGPDGAICGDCSHFFRQPGTSGTYYKCDLRKVTRDVASDHRVRWPACVRYEERS